MTHTEPEHRGVVPRAEGKLGTIARWRRAECGSRAGCARSTGVQLGKSGGRRLAEPETQSPPRLRGGALERQ